MNFIIIYNSVLMDIFELLILLFDSLEYENLIYFNGIFYSRCD